MGQKRIQHPPTALATLAVLAACFASASAHAQAGVAVSADLGTTGAGLHLTVPVAPALNARIGLNYLGYDFAQRSGLVDYDLSGKLHTYDLLADWYVRPGSNFRLTAGLIYNGTRFDARGQPAGGRFTFNGNTYSAAEVGTLNGSVRFRRAAPYFGIGWGNALSPDKRWQFNADIGAFYQGKARVRLAALGCTVSSAACDALARDLAVEELRLQDDVSDYRLFPVLRASLSYSF
ncbi:hypothetical protein [Massilia consociata]|uniref:Histidine kinase n=1 Tax=Massilia consociata TaxID=760117 RepID=A0ABV6FKH4_9BURK